MTDELEWTAPQVLSRLKDMLSERDIRYEQRFEAQERRNEQRFEAQEKALTAALASVERAANVAVVSVREMAAVVDKQRETWEKNANEWRMTVTDLVGLCTSKVDHNALKERVDRMEGSYSGKKDLTAWAIAAVSIVIAAVMAVLAYFKSPGAHG